MITAIIGGLGCGKTMLLTAIAHDAYKHKKHVYANYFLSFPHTKISRIDDLEHLRMGVVLFDELWIFADSRRWSSQQNQVMDRFLLQSRKMGLDFYYTTQAFGQVDNRIRGITDQLLAPRMIRDKEKVPIGVVYSIFSADPMGNLVYRRKSSADVSDVKDMYQHREIIYGFDSEGFERKSRGKGNVQVDRCIDALKDLDIPCYKVPASGHYQDVRFDIVARPSGRLSFIDVVSCITTDGYPRITTGRKDHKALRENAKEWEAIPYYGFEKQRGEWFFGEINADLIDVLPESDARLDPIRDFFVPINALAR